MTLQEAYQGWHEQQQNKPLFAKTREAFRKVWFALPTNKPCPYYTKEILGEALAATDQAEENKAKAASVMIHVLTFASSAEPGDNPRPSFTFGDLMAYTRKPVPAARHKRRVKTEDNVQPAPKSEPETGQKSGDSVKVGTNSAIQTKLPELLPDFDEAQGTPAPKPKRPLKEPAPEDRICQLDTKTLEVIRRWPHAHRIMQELGIGNVVRAIERCGIAGGFYWTYARDLDTFSERLAARQQHNAKAHADHCAQMRAAKNPQKENKPRTDTEDTEKKSVKPVKSVSKKKADQTTPAPPDSGGEAAAQESRRSAASKALEVFTDDELFAELDRRGWFCVLSRTEIVTIGLED